MALTVEDGTGVSGANSYVSLADARTRATTLGVSISGTDGTAELQLEQAALYIENMYRARFQGYKSEYDQAMQWPRSPVVVDGYVIDSDSIPQELIDAQVYAAAQLESGESFYINNDGKNIQREKIDVIEVTYFNTGKTGTQVRFSDVEMVISPLLGSGNGGKYSYVVKR